VPNQVVPAHTIGLPVDLDDPRVSAVRHKLPADAEVVRAFVSRVPAGHREEFHRHELRYAAFFLTSGEAEAVAPDGRVLATVTLAEGAIRLFDNVPVDHALRAGDQEAAYLAVEFR